MPPSESRIQAAIEGSEIHIKGQDIKPAGRPRIIKGIDEVVYPIDVKKRGDATIIAENNPKKRRVKEYSMLDVGSEISGKSLWGFSGDAISRGDLIVGGNSRTGRHPGQELTIKGGCFMQIIRDWSNKSILTHPKTELLK